MSIKNKLTGLSVIILGLVLLSCNSKSRSNNTTIMDIRIASLNKETVKKFFSALENEDVNSLVDLFAEDAQHINPYHSDLFPKGAEGKKGFEHTGLPFSQTSMVWSFQ